MTTITEFYTLDEMAEKLGLKRETLSAYISRGDFPEPVRLGKIKVYPRKMLDRLLDEAMRKQIGCMTRRAV